MFFGWTLIGLGFRLDLGQGLGLGLVFGLGLGFGWVFEVCLGSGQGLGLGLGFGLVNRWGAATTKHIQGRKPSTNDYKIGMSTVTPPCARSREPRPLLRVDKTPRL